MFSPLHCQEWSSSDSAGRAGLHVWQQEGPRDDRDSDRQVPARHCPGPGGDADEQNGLLGLSACHCHLTTADVRPIVLFLLFWWKEKRRGLRPCLWVGGTQSRCSVEVLRGFCRRTHVLQDDFILSWSHCSSEHSVIVGLVSINLMDGKFFESK